MDIAHHDGAPRAYWFVGASWDESEDQTPRFLDEGIWENGYDDRYLDEVRSMRPGERIAIKSTYTRRHGLPFDNRGESVSVMAIKATGTISENPPREWYFHTFLWTVHGEPSEKTGKRTD